jgi:hypothetical protein
MAGALVLNVCGPASAHPLSLAECREGGEFIRHAAMSRDAGITRQFFLERLEQDIALVQAFPPELRWFVQDDDDARLLTAAAARVFDEPANPEKHEARFISDCIQTVGLESDQRR